VITITDKRVKLDKNEDKVSEELKKADEVIQPKPALGKILNRAKSGEKKDKGKKGDKK
jgi:hypothetical protein